MTDQELLKSIIRGWCDDVIVQDKGLAAVNRLVQSPPIPIKVHNNIIELSSGYIFAKGSVVSVGPVLDKEGWFDFEVTGVGFKTVIHNTTDYYETLDSHAVWRKKAKEQCKAFRQEVVDKLLKDG